MSLLKALLLGAASAFEKPESYSPSAPVPHVLDVEEIEGRQAPDRGLVETLFCWEMTNEEIDSSRKSFAAFLAAEEEADAEWIKKHGATDRLPRAVRAREAGRGD